MKTTLKMLLVATMLLTLFSCNNHSHNKDERGLDTLLSPGYGSETSTTTDTALNSMYSTQNNVAAGVDFVTYAVADSIKECITAAILDAYQKYGITSDVTVTDTTIDNVTDDLGHEIEIGATGSPNGINLNTVFCSQSHVLNEYRDIALHEAFHAIPYPRVLKFNQRERPAYFGLICYYHGIRYSFLEEAAADMFALTIASDYHEPWLYLPLFLLLKEIMENRMITTKDLVYAHQHGDPKLIIAKALNKEENAVSDGDVQFVLNLFNEAFQRNSYDEATEIMNAKRTFALIKQHGN